MRASPRAVRRAVLRWARRVDRPLPWRGERDPYRVLVAEVMLQQTQARRVAAAYGAFLARFPTVEALAEARAEDVLRAWDGLGYNRRALALWRAARQVAAGGWPRSVEALHCLPGVGAYTARAVASFAFGLRTGVVDANVRRVLRRLDPGEDPQALADLLVSRESGPWNQALIDLGALVCRPRRPACPSCPLRRWCAAARGGRPEDARPRHRDDPRPRHQDARPSHRDDPRPRHRDARPSHRDDPPPRRDSLPFPQTPRYARGRVVAALRVRDRSLRELAEETGLPGARIEAAVVSLERDGLVHRRGGLVRLGPRTPARNQSSLAEA